MLKVNYAKFVTVSNNSEIIHAESRASRNSRSRGDPIYEILEIILAILDIITATASPHKTHPPLRDTLEAYGSWRLRKIICPNRLI